ncbi:MAG: alpha/beta hydrolase fold domain-containing protein [Alphaproteobacteria bacterium]|nr:alpha/beta hydrolase fold domain-containing protein [Alphaproteobacteria bacterium SS10]
MTRRQLKTTGLAIMLMALMAAPNLTSTASAQFFGGEPDQPAAIGPNGEPLPGANGRPNPQDMDPEQLLGFLMRRDANGDGAISKEEAPTRLQRGFDRMDQDGDGLLTQPELERAISFFSQRQKQGGQSGGQTDGQTRGLFQGRPSGPPPTATVDPSSADVPYSGTDNPRQALDIYQPGTSNGAAPILMMIHGGAWAVGDKASGVVTANPVPFFTEQGWVYTSINYRLVPDVTFREQAADVASAITWLHQNAASFGGDPDQIYIMGHSAGAHLAALTAIDGQYLEAAGGDQGMVKGAVLLDGAAYDLLADGATNRVTKFIYDRAFGTEEADLKAASPVHQIASGGDVPPFLIAHVDRAAAADASANLANALNAAGYQTTLYQAPDGYNHSAIMTRLGADQDEVGPTVLNFLTELTPTQ